MRARLAQRNGSPNIFHPLYAHLARNVLHSQSIDVSAPALVITNLCNLQVGHLDKLKQEFINLRPVCKKGSSEYHYRVFRPLSKSEKIACLLVEVFACGHNLDLFISKEAYAGRHDQLFSKITEPAHFFAALQNRTAGTTQVYFVEYSNCFRGLV